jgi:biotin transporter BioY
MVQPWFDQIHYAWIPGTVYAVAAGLMGGLVGWLAPRGRARNFVLRAWLALWLVAVALLVAGFVALSQSQPWGIWYGFLLPGAIGTIVVGINTYVVHRAYRLVEERKLAARDLL